MAQIRFENGAVVDFQGNPTPQDVEEVASKMGLRPATPKPKTSPLQKVTSVANAVFPGKQIGQAIGTLGGYGITAAKEKLGYVPKGTTAQYDLSAPSTKRVVADAASAGLNVIGLKGIGSSSPFLQRVAQNIGLGAGIGGANTIADGGSTKSAIKNAVATGAVGGALSVAGGGAGLIGKQIAKLPDRFLNSALGRTKAQILRNPKAFNDFVLKNKRIGTADSLIGESQEAIQKIDSQINSLLSSASRKSGGKITIGRDNVLDTVASTPSAVGSLFGRNEVFEVVSRLAPQTRQLLLKPSLTLEEANKLRSLVDRTLGDRAFLGGQLSNEKEILKSFANTLRETVKNKAPSEVRPLFSEYSNEIQFRDGLTGKMAQASKNQVLSFGDIMGGTIGGIAGGGLPGALVGIGARRFIESTPAKIGAAKAIRAISKVAPIIDQMTPAQQTTIMVLIANLLSDEGDD